MSLLPDIEDGKLKEHTEPRLYRAPKAYVYEAEEKRLAELNNLGHEMVADDFSDSPHLNN